MEIALPIYMGSVFAFGTWALVASWRFTVLYKRVYGIDLIAQQQRDFLKGSLGGQTLQTWRLIWKKQDPPELEKARRQLAIAIILAFGVAIFGFILLAALAATGIL
ncbi:MAG: hypothetical protein M1319_01740 [Chloroflexi bacterium]|nr:hypothetical protein [Chloroflexota bacterium]